MINREQQILFFKGLPGSGKSTEAKKMCAEDPNIKRLNKDDIRIALGNPSYSRTFEKIVLESQRKAGVLLLKQGYSIIIDDTNFAPKHWGYWEEISKGLGIEILEFFFDTPLEVCIQRDKEREKSVGKGVIMDMYNRYLNPVNNGNQ